MKFSLKDHPYLLLFCVALLMFACSLAIGFVYSFSVYAITHGNGIPDKVAEAWLEYHAETSQHQQIFP